MAAISVSPLHHRQRLLLLLLSLSCLAVAGIGSGVPALIVFGDSTVDPGNNNYIHTPLKSNFPPYGRDFPGGRPTGRFCNGRLAIDFISEALGLLPAVPAYLGPECGIEDSARAVSFASSGTGLDNATAALLNVIPLWEELEFFKEYQDKLIDYAGRARARRIVTEAMYIVSVGTNDFLVNYFAYVTGRAAEFRVEEFASFLVGVAGDFVAELYRLGARKIAFIGLGLIGCVPLERTGNLLRGDGGCVEEYNEAAEVFNAKLQEMVRRLGETLPELRLRYSPVYEQFAHIISNPSTYGIENVADGCCGTGRMEIAYTCNEWNPFTCEDADRYAFWDGVHPTQKIYSLLAQAMLENAMADLM